MSQNNTSTAWFNYQAVRWAMDFPTRSIFHKAVLMIVASYVDKDGCCFPSQQTIAERAMMSRRKVCSVLAELEADGALSRERQRKRCNRYGCDILWLNFRPCAPRAHEYKHSLKTEGSQKKTLGTEGIRDPRDENATTGPRRRH